MLMRRLSYPMKFVLIGIMFVPFIAFGYLLINQYNERSQFAVQESVGLDYLEPVRVFLQNVQQHRGMANAFLSGNPSFRDKISVKQKDLAQIIASVDDLDQALGQQLNSTDRWQALKVEWQTLVAGVRQFTPQESFAAHSKLIEHTLDFIEHINSSSNLGLDPQMDSHHLAESLMQKIPSLSEQLAQARALGTSALSRGKLTMDEQTRLNSLSSAAATSSRDLNNSLIAIFATNPSIKGQLASPLERTMVKVHDFNSYVEQLVKQDNKSSSDPTDASDSERATAYFNKSTATIDAVFAFANTVSPVLHHILEERAERLNQFSRWLLGCMALVLTVIAYLFVTFYRVVNASVHDMSEFAAGLARGDLTIFLNNPTRDELGKAAQAFNQAIQKLRGLMVELTGSGTDLANSSQNLVQVADQTQQNMLRQQSETDQVATAMEEMSATAQHIAISGGEAASAANQANQVASEGRQVVDQTISTVHSLATDVENTASLVQRVVEDSANINVVLDVIKGIAEQTNLLALNAAIEAARAGEQGRGFAVVADEVRVLASRTQQSTETIRQSIERLQTGTNNAIKSMTESRNQARNTVEKAEGARRSLESITHSVERIHDMNNQIGSATEEQSQVVESVNRNLSTVTQIGIQTVNGAKEIASASNHLADLAKRLKSQIGNFKV